MPKKKRGLQVPSPAQQKQYQREARLQYGPSEVDASIQRWQSYSEAQQAAIIAEGEQIYQDLAAAMLAGKQAGDASVKDLLDRWQAHLQHFYEPSLDRLRGLGQLYNSSPEFIATFQNIHIDLPAYLERVIESYVDELETAYLERMLAEDEELQKRRSNLSR